MKNLKTIIKVTSAICSLSATIMGVYYTFIQLTTTNRKTKRLIEEVWESNKAELRNTLKLLKMPTLTFNTNSTECLMSVSHTSTYMVNPTNYLENIVQATTPTYDINVSLSEITNFIKTTKLSFLAIDDDITRSVIKQLLSHECRHIWQAQGDFYIGTRTRVGDFTGIFEGHGEAIEEVDANEFSVSCANTDEERMLFLFLKRQQELQGKFMYTRDEECSQLYKQVFRKRHPFYNLFKELTE